MKYLFSLLITSIVGVSLFAPVASAENLQEINNATLDQVYSGTSALGETKTTSIYTVLGRIITVIISVAGFLTLVLILRSGLQIMTAGGDAKKIEDSKKRLVYLVIGLIILLASGILSNFILNLVSGAIRQ